MEKTQKDVQFKKSRITDFNISRLTDETVFHILYLRHIKAMSLKRLKEQFTLDSESLEKLLDGRVRKEPYRNFMKVKKHLNDKGQP